MASIKDKDKKHVEAKNQDYLPNSREAKNLLFFNALPDALKRNDVTQILNILSHLNDEDVGDAELAKKAYILITTTMEQKDILAAEQLEQVNAALRANLEESMAENLRIKQESENTVAKLMAEIAELKKTQIYVVKHPEEAKRLSDAGLNAQSKTAEDYAREVVMPAIITIRATGTTSFNGISNALNNMNIKPPKHGKKWYSQTVKDYLATHDE